MIVVTRHVGLVALLEERGIIPRPSPAAGRGECPYCSRESPDGGVCGCGLAPQILTHVDDPAQIRGRHVIGVLPLSLAVECASVTEIPLALTPADRGVELGIERLREIAGEARTYVVREVQS